MTRHQPHTLTLLVLILSAVVATATIADGPQVLEKGRLKMVSVSGSDAETFNLHGDELEVGESRQFFTDDGEEIVITRTEEGFELTVEGESSGEAQTKVLQLRGSGTAELDIESDGTSLAFIKVDDDSEGTTEHRAVWLSSDGAQAHAFAFGDAPSAVERL